MMTTRVFLIALLGLLSACNELLEIRPPADQLLVLDASQNENPTDDDDDDDAGSD